MTVERGQPVNAFNMIAQKGHHWTILVGKPAQELGEHYYVGWMRVRVRISRHRVDMSKRPPRRMMCSRKSVRPQQCPSWCGVVIKENTSLGQDGHTLTALFVGSDRRKHGAIDRADDVRMCQPRPPNDRLYKARDLGLA